MAAACCFFWTKTALNFSFAVAIAALLFDDGIIWRVMEYSTCVRYRVISFGWGVEATCVLFIVVDSWYIKLVRSEVERRLFGWEMEVTCVSFNAVDTWYLIYCTGTY